MHSVIGHVLSTKSCPFTWGNLDPSIHGSLAHLSPTQRASRSFRPFCTAHGWTLQCPYLTWFHGPTWANKPYGIWIISAVFIGHVAVLRMQMWPVVTEQVVWSVTVVSPAKTAETIEIPFGFWTRGGPKESCIRWGADPPWEGAILGKGVAHCKV